MPNPIVELVEKEMAAFRELRLAHPNLFPANNNLYPIPFFGDIRRAEVVTIALNPARKEFDARGWPIGTGPGSLTPTALTNRLLGYFHSLQNSPADLFDICNNALSVLECSYQTNSAHLDIHPFPTKFAGEMNSEEKILLRAIIEARSAEHLVSVLALCERVRLMIVVEFTLPGTPNLNTFPFVRAALASQIGLVDAAGLTPPLIDGTGRNGIAARLQQQQGRLMPFLKTAPKLVFSPSIL